MQLRPSMRRAAKMRLALAGASGSGQTYSSLLIAYGMTSDWSRVAVIDSENGSADLYAHLGNYQVLTLPDYSPETYIEAIGICEQAGAEVIVIDSISHCWDYLLDFHANLQGNSFANWAKVTPRQNAFIQRILNSSCHIICTMRSITLWSAPQLPTCASENWITRMPLKAVGKSEKVNSTSLMVRSFRV